MTRTRAWRGFSKIQYHFDSAGWIRRRRGDGYYSYPGVYSYPYLRGSAVRTPRGLSKTIRVETRKTIIHRHSRPPSAPAIPPAPAFADPASAPPHPPAYLWSSTYFAKTGC